MEKKRCWVSIEGVGGGWIEKAAEYHGYTLRSIIQVCPKCHKTWATILYEGDFDAFPVATSCYPCNRVFDSPFTSLQLQAVPGSILDSYTTNERTDWTLLEALPTELIRRELDLHLKAFEKETGK